MRKSVLNGLVAVVLGLLTAQIGRAQGSATFLSNLTQPSSGGVAVGSNSWIAATFFTGGNTGGYSLNSVQLAMNDPSGAPSGFTVMIYSEGPFVGAILPGNSVGLLTGSDPRATGVFSYSPQSALTLAPSSPYFIVVTSTTTVGTGAYEWSLSGANAYNPTGGWAVTGGVSSAVYSSANGLTWTSLSATHPQFAVNATPTPEPGVVVLLAMGGLLISVRQRNEKKRS